jgi:hypothetical protein
MRKKNHVINQILKVETEKKINYKKKILKKQQLKE